MFEIRRERLSWSTKVHVEWRDGLGRILGRGFYFAYEDDTQRVEHERLLGLREARGG